MLDEIWRILTPGGVLFFFDRILFKPRIPAEELVILTENAYHKALEYALGVKYWGLKTPEEYLSRIQERGFKLLETRRARGKHVDGKTFLRSWGKDTQRLLETIKDNDKKRELESLIKRIREQGAQHGYGPAEYVIVVFEKPSQPLL